MKLFKLLVVFAWLAAPCSGQAISPPATRPVTADSFIYFRRNFEGTANTTDSVLLARLTEAGIDLQNAHTGRNLMSLRPVCVIAGKLYCAGRGTTPLVAIDLTSGEAQKFSVTILPAHVFDPVKQRIYFRDDSDAGSPVIRAIDLPSLSTRVVTPAPGSRRPGSIVLSPDAKRLAYLELQVGGPAGPGPWDTIIHLVDIEAREHSIFPKQITYLPPSVGGGGAISNDMIAWQDNHTLLTITNGGRGTAPGGRTFAGGPGDDALTAIDLDTKQVTRLSPLPIPGAFAQIIQATSTNELTVMLTTPRSAGPVPTVTRYAYNPTSVSLQERPTSVGRFMLEGGMRYSAAGNQDARTITLDGKRIATTGLRPMTVSVSPDGQRLLYLIRDASRNSLHLYDATTQIDRLVDVTSPDEPYLWVSSTDLVPRPAVAPPLGFTPLTAAP